MDTPLSSFEPVPFPRKRLSLPIRLGVALFFVLLTTPVGRAQASPSAADNFQSHPTIIVDLRTGKPSVRQLSRDAFADMLSAHGEISLQMNAELRAILSRAPYSARVQSGQKTLHDASLAFGQLDCPSAVQLAKQAILDFAVAEASGTLVREPLHKLYLLLLLCAHRHDDVAQATAAATALRVINDDERPREISVNTWQRYQPPVQQSPLAAVPVTFQSTPPQATLWVDHQPIGTTPRRHSLHIGEHLVAMSTDAGSASRVITVTQKGTIHFSLKTIPPQWPQLPAIVEQLRIASASTQPQIMSSLLANANANIAFVMRDSEAIDVWKTTPLASTATRLGAVTSPRLAAPMALGTSVNAKSTPERQFRAPLLRERKAPAPTFQASRPWWLYGTILGIAAAGAGFILIQDLSDDTQRIEVRLP